MPRARPATRGDPATRGEPASLASGGMTHDDTAPGVPPGDAPGAGRGNVTDDATANATAGATTAAPRGSEPIPYEEIARRPLPGMAHPVQWSFSPDGSVLTYLHDPEGGLSRRLYALGLPSPATDGDPPGPAAEVALEAGVLTDNALSLEQQLRRERARELGLGVTSCSWAAEADALLVPLPDGLRVVRGLQPGGGPLEVSLVLPSDPSAWPGAGEAVAPELSPDGRRVAFVRDGDLHVLELETGEVRRLTATAGEALSNGLAEYVAQEEMDRAEGFWWSHDSARLAFTEVDERHMPAYRIVHQGADDTGPRAEEEHRYPFSGRANAKIRLGVVPAAGGGVVFMDLGEEDQYLARVRWLRDGRLLAELESRDQTRLDVVSLDPATGERSLIHSERCEPYLNLHDDFRELAEGEWLWSSEGTGFRHLEVRGPGGELRRVLTEGEWQVDRVEAVDEEQGLVFFTGTADGPTECHLYSVPLAGGEPPRRLTPEAGTHQVKVAPGGRMFLDRYASLASPPSIRVRSLGDGSVVAVVHDAPDERVERLGLDPPELIELEADDGAVLYGLWYAPAQHAPVRKGDASRHPLVVQVYGGPHVQLATNDWRATVEMRSQALRRFGIGVLVVDNRGSARRGLRHETAIHRRMGTLEVADQVAGVRWATEQRGADPERVGVYGWSYGGYMTLRLLALAPETFRAGVAGAPVTDWDGYDTHYTERYMGTPASNRDGYRSSSVLPLAGSIRGALMLVHGLIDENVHFRHTARLLDRLVGTRTRHELLCFPSERHMPRREEDRAFMEEQVIDFLRRELVR